MWHLTLYTLHREAHRDAGPLPGLWVGQAGKKAPRPRRQEVLVLYLSQEGPAPLPPAEADKLLAALGQRYFREGGSTTRALRAALNDLNLYLLRRNRRLADQGMYAVARLAAAVWRGDRLVVGLSGPLHAYFIAEQVTHLHEPTLAGRGLGTNRTPRLHFAALEPVPLALLALAPQPLAADPQSLRLRPTRRPDPLMRRLLSSPLPDLQAVLVHMHPGAGEHRLRALPAQLLTPGPSPSAEDPFQKAAPASESPLFGEPSAAPPSPAATPTAPQEESPRPAAPKAPSPTSAPLPPEGPPSRRPKPAGAAAEPSLPPSPPPQPQKQRASFSEVWGQTRARLGRWLRPWGSRLRAAAQAVGAAVRQILPATEEWVSLPPSMMAFAALAVPLVVVTFAVTVYVHRGRAQQFALYFAQAQVAAQEAQAASDEATRYNALLRAEVALRQALVYGDDPQAQRLKQQIVSQLDLLDKVDRLAFRPLLDGGTLRGREIRRMVVLSNEIYLLDAREGEVLHLQGRGGSFQLDSAFRCGPDQYAQVQVGPLVDFVAFSPLSGKDYAVAAVDAQGHMVFCAPGAEPYARSLPLHTRLPSQGRVMRLLGEERLYLLDPAHRALQVFSVADDFGTQPYNLLAGEDFPWVDQVSDFAVQRGALFVLLRDGQVVRCDQTSPTSPLACTGMTYHDTRPGRGEGPTLVDMRPVQLEVSTLQEPALFMLDAQGEAIFLFSFDLRYSRQFKPQTPLAGPITTFEVASSPLPTGERMLYVAAGEQIYGAPTR